jgi:hypothetical protein
LRSEARGLARQRLDARPVAAGDGILRRDPGATDADDVAERKVGGRIPGVDAAGRAEADGRQRRSERLQVGNAAGRLGGKNFRIV